MHKRRSRSAIESERNPFEVSEARLPFDSNPKTRDCVEETRESWVGGKSSKRGPQSQNVITDLEPKWQRFVSSVGEHCTHSDNTHTHAKCLPRTLAGEPYNPHRSFARQAETLSCSQLQV